ncbi:DUF4382 domain-containing protein [Noviherbaspirillum pedocola]|uniref:DUF4382 domain-containing protein n=1 Tax=Noviherbaspirillum pedocola TaxID=2801341 RepID=A0A934SU06_9BURK|nr:DUF4382 domain-containing protein [Noviherbaspirillum pedocola]MBK4735198.1 DUF4382 domain-containing protein [Noviherbaspirillum pedocola]
MKPTYLAALLGAIASAALLAACGGGGGGDSTGSTSGNGTLGVSLTDAPSCGYDAVNVTVTKVRVHQSASASDTDAGWTDITLNPARKINLLSLSNGVLSALGETPLAPGHYTQLRLVLGANSNNVMANSVIRTGSTTEIALDTPSAVQSGIKLGHAFDVVAGQRVDLVLDFDACTSIVARGNKTLALKPVVKVVPTAVNGIDGFVNPALAGSHVEVSAQQNGQIVASTAPDASTGEFFLSRLAPGSYDVVITADGKAATVIASVPVASTTATVAVSTKAAPIDPASAATPARDIGGTVTLSPAGASDTAYVAAQQTLASGMPVTIRYRSTDLAPATYALTGLPTVPPQVAQYSATLPLSFAAQPTVSPGVGKYAVQASASGYTAKSVGPVDLTSASQSGVNLTLLP